MDPLTAALELANTIARIVEKAIDGQPPDVRVELWRMYFEDVKAFRAFLESLRPKPPNP